MRAILGVLLFTVFCLCPMAGRAESIIFSDFGPGMSFDPNRTEFQIIGPSVVCCGGITGQNSWDAAPFTSSGNLTLERIDLALSSGQGTNGAIIDLTNTINGQPGTTLESWTLTGLPPVFTSFSPESLNSVLFPTLSSGAEYWIVVQPIANDSVAAWQSNNTGTTGGFLYTEDGGGLWAPPCVFQQNCSTNTAQIMPAFDVVAIATPEPSSVLLLGTGLLGLIAMTRRERRLT